MESSLFTPTRPARVQAPVAPPPAAPAFDTDSYVTDGTRLLRCLSVDGSRHPFASALFEDCYSLEVVIVPMVELPDRGFRVVRR